MIYMYWILFPQSFRHIKVTILDHSQDDTPLNIEPSERTVEVDKVHHHKDYIPSTKQNDMAVLIRMPK